MLYIIEALIIFIAYIGYVYYETQKFLLEKINQKKREFEHARANLENMKQNIFMTIRPLGTNEEIQIS